MHTVTWNKKIVITVCTVIVILFMTLIFNRKSQPPRSRTGMLKNGHSYSFSPPIVGVDPAIIDRPLQEKNRIRTFALKRDGFYISGQKTRILSGAVHYFRIVPEYWLDRLIRLKSAGLNTVETYVPWNRHEEIKGRFNFKGILDIRRFITLAQDLGLYVILRPGPYICSEWEFGGMPSWLLRDKHMKVRSTYEPFMQAVDRFFKELFRQVADLQWHYFGPIIMMQIENEYGSFGSDAQYMLQLDQIMKKHGVREVLFVSDNLGGLKKMDLSGVLKTTNLKKVSAGKTAFRYLKATQSGKPLMVMEFWSGWFDVWGSQHNTFSTKDFQQSLQFILEEGSSVNFYMFHGGTNFGFMNGQHGHSPDVTSYDYDAPISEAGDVMPKYHVIRELIVKHKLNKTALPDVPLNAQKAGYGVLKVSKVLHWPDILSLIQPLGSNHLVTMEMLDHNNGSGQGYGFIVYQHSIPQSRHLNINGHMNDRAQILLNGKEIKTLDHIDGVQTTIFKNNTLKEQNILDIVVENTGRINWGSGNIFNEQRKGLDGVIKADDVQLSSWKIYPLELKMEFIKRASKLSVWKSFTNDISAPALYEMILNIDSMPMDTFLNMKGWHKGVVFVNGYNLGRYWHIGPTHSIYVPAPLLVNGKNKIIIFELHKAHDQIVSIDTPILS